MKLTGRELEIITLLAEGFLDKEIAEKLKISVRTVQSYTRQIYIKLAARNRTQAVASFFRKNLNYKLKLEQ